MKKILLSIHPKYVERILDGSKKYEFRTKAAKKDVDKIIVYSTYPIKKIVAEVEILEVLEMSPNDLWEMTKEFSGIDKEDYDKYYKNRSIAYAYKLGKVKSFVMPRNLNYYGIKNAPQSFVYVN